MSLAELAAAIDQRLALATEETTPLGAARTALFEVTAAIRLLRPNRALANLDDVPHH